MNFQSQKRTFAKWNECTRGNRVQMTPTKREKKPLQCNFLVTFEIQAYVNAFSGYQWNLDQNAFSLNSFCFLYLGVFASTNFHFEIEHSS